MRYAKLINGSIRYAPKTVRWTDEDGKAHTVNNPAPDKLLELGYLPVTYTDPPADAPEGRHYESHWEQAETAIVQTWHLVDDPVYPEYPPEPTMQDLADAVERGAYHMMAEVIEALVRYSQSQLTKESQEAEDKTLAISCAALFRPWEPGKYKAGNIRIKDGVPYEARIDHDNAINPDWTIDVRTVWKPYHSRQKKWALPFIHPTCADDMYKAGEYAVFKDKTYMANQDTSFSPEEYPGHWTEV